MESNEISMFMDAKLDVNDKRAESVRLRTWTKCLVKIEAIKCFPCYLRITFIRNVEDESANLCIRINVPGISIRLASSRTKSFSYGIFWKQNRKRCCIFFAFESQTSCERHMKWFKKSLKNLELHRQEILETRRASRENSSIIEFTKNLDITSFDNLNDGNNKKNLQDILGPLPRIPDFRESINWSRRISGASGIYEEIPDFENSRRFSRASGIYEEMKPPRDFSKILSQNNESPPPLPPRGRINTYEAESLESIPRSNTNPESILEAAKKKKILKILENVLNGGRSKRSESVSEGTVSTTEELFDPINTSTTISKPSHIYVNINPINNCNNKNNNNNDLTPEVTPRMKRKFTIGDQKNKRNSFSSPDLSKIINPFDEFEISEDGISLSSEIDPLELSQSAENVHYIDKIELCNENEIAEYKSDHDIESELNVSERINENFNFSCNSSTINLVGSNLIPKCSNIGLSTASSINGLIDDFSGYCTMAPIKPKSEIEQKCDFETLSTNSQNIQKSSDSDKENEDFSYNSTNSVKQNSETLNHKLYENMNSGLENTTPIYQNLISNTPDLIPNKNKIKEDYYQTPRKSIISIDEKIPSYYPNNCDNKTNNQRVRRSNSNSSDTKSISKTKPTTTNASPLRHLTGQRVKKRENVYIESPKKIMEHSRKFLIQSADVIENLGRKTPIKACKISENVYSVKRLCENEFDNPETPPPLPIKSIKSFEPTESETIISISFSSAINNIDFTFDDSNNSKYSPDIKDQCTPETNSRIYQKYSATMTRSAPNKYIVVSHNNNSSKPNILINNEKHPTAITNATPDSTGSKKFASLPRFKKIDFSPLKLKINNVLQRNNSDGL